MPAILCVKICSDLFDLWPLVVIAAKRFAGCEVGVDFAATNDTRQKVDGFFLREFIMKITPNDGF